MAKSLTAGETAHPLRRLLNPNAALDATRPLSQPVEESAHGRSVSPRHRRPPTIKRECVLSTTTDDCLTRLTELIRRSTGARINTSIALRSVLLAVNTAWTGLEDELRATGPLQLPSNASGNESRREAIEQELAAAIRRAMRSAASRT